MKGKFKMNNYDNYNNGFNNNGVNNKPPKKKMPFWQKLLIGFAILVFIGAVNNKDDSSNESHEQKQAVEVSEASPTPTVAPVCVDTYTLSNSYRDNEIAADAIYKDKIVEVSGYLKNVNVTLGVIELVLYDGNNYSYNWVYCIFKDKEPLANLKSGDYVTVRGTGSGFSTFPKLVDCEVVS